MSAVRTVRAARVGGAPGGGTVVYTITGVPPYTRLKVSPRRLTLLLPPPPAQPAAAPPSSPPPPPPPPLVVPAGAVRRVARVGAAGLELVVVETGSSDERTLLATVEGGKSEAEAAFAAVRRVAELAADNYASLLRALVDYHRLVRNTNNIIES